jgi:hypothetical protein
VVFSGSKHWPKTRIVHQLQELVVSHNAWIQLDVVEPRTVGMVGFPVCEFDKPDLIVVRAEGQAGGKREVSHTPTRQYYLAHRIRGRLVLKQGTQLLILSRRTAPIAYVVRDNMLRNAISPE